ncbi:hypothetical protein HCN44_005411 [Aphidius gifuensis]|uniref:ATP synthase subunit gamma n=1 Tax=Aphidius gifuensis TaxID=684658 RepID=A0A834Y4P0_APHGI|nr:hypothetical protein HCN44_005411 [Aphidius gifuensis]
MSSLKVIKSRIKSVGNTKKISQTMKLVSSAKYSRSQKELIQARKFGVCPKLLFDYTELQPNKSPNSQLFVAITSDRGLCGAINSGLSRVINRTIDKLNNEQKNLTKLICIGQKNYTILSRLYSDKIILVASEVGKKSLTFIDAGNIAQEIMKIMNIFEFSRTRIYYNKFINAATYKVDYLDLYDKKQINSAPKFPLYDGINDDTIDCWLEFSITTMIYWIIKESSTSEYAARMTSMENATKNASDMIKNLSLEYNRTRQAVITGELIEIISGASALK